MMSASYTSVVIWLSGSISFNSIDILALRWAWLVLAWMTVRWFELCLYHLGIQ